MLEEKERRRTTAAAEAALESEAATTGARLATFVRAAWHVLEPKTPLKWGWALDAICEHLEAVTAGRIVRLLINVPPGCMKSMLVNVFWPAWEWGPRGLAHLRYVGVSHADHVSIRDSLKMRRLVESDWYRRRWPSVVLVKRGEARFDNDALGFRIAVPAESVTGERGDRVLIDDPISAVDANSDAMLSRRENWFREAVRNRVNDPETSATVIIMQRLHDRDTSGIILSGGFDYVHLCLPMEFEADRRCRTTIGFVDPRQHDGELLFPERFSREHVEAEKVMLGAFGVAGQFQQRPIPRGGAIFRAAWCQTRWREWPDLSWRMIFADTAQKIKEQNDWSVFQCWGRGRDRKIYLLDQIRGRWEAPDLLSRARAFWRVHVAHNGPQYGALRGMRIEDKSSGTGLVQQLRRGGDNIGPIPVTGIERTAGQDKRSRAFDACPYFEAGMVILPADAHWLPEYERELFGFPRAAHDDQVDPTMDAVKEMAVGGVSMTDVL